MVVKAPADHIRVPRFKFPFSPEFQPPANVHSGKLQVMSQIVGPHHLPGKLDEAPGSWLYPALAPVVAGI